MPKIKKKKGLRFTMTPGPINTAQLCGMRQACDRQMTRLRTLWLHAHDIFTHNMPKYRTFSLPIKVFHAPIIEELLLYSTTKWVSLSPRLCIRPKKLRQYSLFIFLDLPMQYHSYCRFDLRHCKILSYTVSETPIWNEIYIWERMVLRN